MSHAGAAVQYGRYPAGLLVQPDGIRRRHEGTKRNVRSEQDIVEAVMRARDAGRRVRAIGSGGSKNRCYDTTGTRLDLTGFGRLVDIDGPRVTVEAGMPCGRLFALLRANGLAIPTPGEWNGATAGGAVSTGTHGGSSRHGCLATSVCRIRLVTADGSVVTLERGSDAFAHAGVSLGLLGIVSQLTFECAERFHLSLERQLVSFDEVIASRSWADRDAEYWSAVWFPQAGCLLSYSARRCARPRRCTRRVLRYDSGTALLSAASQRFGRLPFLTRGLLRHVACGDSHEMLSPIGYTPRRVRLWQRLGACTREVEFAIPLERAVEVLLAFESFLGSWPGALNLPVGLRATARDDFSLSPCSGRDVLWIAAFFRDEPRFAAALATFFSGFDARCHWGKHIGLSPDHLRRQYRCWPAFSALRGRVDPDNTFANRFTEELGL